MQRIIAVSSKMVFYLVFIFCFFTPLLESFYSLIFVELSQPGVGSSMYSIYSHANHMDNPIIGGFYPSMGSGLEFVALWAIF